MVSVKRLGLAVALVATACSASGSEIPTDGSTPSSRQPSVVTIMNQGDTSEGHTPIGFAGTGTGLFVGDNLNSSFPDGDGVQTYMTFTLPVGLGVSKALLSSDVLSVRGTPFDDLGSLVVERVEYETFGPQLFDLPAISPASRCEVTDASSVVCDVTEIVASAADDGRRVVQFRLRFEQVADGDGQADLAQFYRSDVNTNEPGLFELTITGES